jgi:hypothetical protein
MDAPAPEKPHLRAWKSSFSPDFPLQLPKNFTFNPHFFPILLTDGFSAARLTRKTTPIHRPESAHRCISRNSGLSLSQA